MVNQNPEDLSLSSALSSLILMSDYYSMFSIVLSHQPIHLDLLYSLAPPYQTPSSAFLVNNIILEHLPPSTSHNLTACHHPSHETALLPNTPYDISRPPSVKPQEEYLVSVAKRRSGGVATAGVAGRP